MCCARSIQIRVVPLIGLPLLSILTFTRPSLAQPQSANQFCLAAKKQTELRPKTSRVFGLVEKDNEDSSGASQDGDWLEFPDLGTLRKMAGVRAIYDIAEVWTLPSGILFVSMYLTSESGDWASFIDYCYRPNGSLARIESDYRFLPGGGTRRIRTQIFSLDGKISSQYRRLFDIKTGKLLTTTSFPRDRDDPVYLTPSSLPFSSQLATVYENSRTH